jgi:acid phosphatase
VLQGLAMLAWAAPARAAAKPFSFLALGDWGRAGGRDQLKVARAMGRTATEVGSRLVLSVGDNFYPAGVQSVSDPQWRTSFEDIYDTPSLQTPWYAALGNHDYRGEPSAQIAYGRQSVRWRMPSRYYMVEGARNGHEDLDIFVLDTTPLVADYEEALMRLSYGRVAVPEADPQLVWLKAALAGSSARWKVVVGHHPIRSGGHHGGSPQLASRVEPLLAAHGVQAYLCGHDHALQHIERGGLHHVCTGAGASAGWVADIEGMRFRGEHTGFAVLTCRDTALALQFRDAEGRAVYDAELL